MSLLNLFATHESEHKPSCNALAQDDVREYACGWGAAFINVIVTFPINKIMFRQMVHGVPTHHAWQQVKSEGFRHLYRGCLPPLIQKTISVSIMFGSFSGYTRLLEERFPNWSRFAVTSTAAVLAGTTEALLAPLERVQALLQDRGHHDRFKNTWHALKELRVFGVTEYYRGLIPILIRNGPSTWMFFTLREHTREVIPFGHDEHAIETFFANFVSGALVGAFISTVFYPINVVKTIMQVEYGTPFMSLRKAFVVAHDARDRNIRKFFYGVHLNYSRALISWGIINASYEFLRKHYSAHFHPCNCNQIITDELGLAKLCALDEQRRLDSDNTSNNGTNPSDYRFNPTYVNRHSGTTSTNPMSKSVIGSSVEVPDSTLGLRSSNDIANIADKSVSNTLGFSSNRQCTGRIS